MAVRTYIPKLLFVLRTTCKYMKFWEFQIKSNLPAGTAITLFDTILASCELLESIIEEDVIVRPT